MPTPGPGAPNVEDALNAWRGELGAARVLTGPDIAHRYTRSTSPIARTIPGAVVARSVRDVVAVLNGARQYGVPVYPISRGCNWGYGDANAVRDNSVILDLSQMDEIVSFERDLGLVTVQPGVTQAQLRVYLDAHGPEFMVPTTGAGPDASLVGNVCERGYGITPYQDHFLAATSLQAVLPSGSVYRSALSELGAAAADRAHKWGIGPYLDGLFTQGNLGVVTEMTLALARRGEQMWSFLFFIRDDRGLEDAVRAVREVVRAGGSHVGGVNIMNARRVRAMSSPSPHRTATQMAVMSRVRPAARARASRSGAWTGVGAIYGTRRMANAVRAEVRRCLRPHVDRLIFMDSSRVSLVRKVVAMVPAGQCTRLTGRLAAAADGHELLAGRPSRVALPLAYWRADAHEPRTWDPAADGCGLVWYSPLVPMRPDDVRRFTQLVHDVCIRHALEPLITLTTLSDRCFDSTVPLLYRRADPSEAARVRACYSELFAAGQREGFVPYRVGVDDMPLVVSESVASSLTRAVKRALDPTAILAPGRYAPLS